MPSNIDKAFIDNLQNFTQSLENIVVLLKQQTDKGGDAVNDLLKSMDSNLSKVVNDMEEVLKVSKNIDNRTKEILEEIKASRKQKEAGMFDKIESKDNKDKIVSGIQTVMLIAGGVLAIGLAFKIIGNVDFLSVIALSMGILAISYAFVEISKIEGLDYKKIAVVGLAMVSMAVAITLSSFALKMFQPVSPIQSMSFVLVGTALGVGSYYIFKAVQNLKDFKPNDMWKYLLLPLLLPAIATGITLSSWALSGMAPVGFIQAISAVFVGVILAVGAFAVSIILKALKSKDGQIDVDGIGMALLIIPGIALGLVSSSWIFQLFTPIKDPLQLIFGSLSMGIALISFLPAVYVLGKMKIDQMLIGALGTVIVATAIMVSSWIFSIGKYDNYPSTKFALGTGLSIILFTPSIVVLGVLGMSGLGAVGILVGAGLTLVVASAIMGVSHILNEGNYGNYPSVGWATGVGLSLLAFTPAILALGVIGLIGSKVIRTGANMVKLMAQNIVDVSHILNEGKFSGGPTEEWAKGIGLSLSSFAYALSLTMRYKMSGFDGDFGDFMVSIAKSMKLVAGEIGSYNWSGLSHPSEEWARGVGGALLPFAQVFEIINSRRKTRQEGAEGFGDFMVTIAKSMISVANVLSDYNWDSVKYPSVGWGEGVSASILPFSDLMEKLNERRKTRTAGGEGFAKLMIDVAGGMVSVAKILEGGNFTNSPDKTWSDNLSYSIKMFNESVQIDKKKIDDLKDFIKVLRDFSRATSTLSKSGIDKLNKLTSSITIMSVIDDNKLRSVINTLGDSKKEFRDILSGVGGEQITSVRQQSTELKSVETRTLSKETDPQKLMIEKFDVIITKFDELIEYIIMEKAPDGTGNRDSIKK